MPDPVRSMGFFKENSFRIQYRQVAPRSSLKGKAPPPDTTTGVQLVDTSDLKGVYARAVEDKSSDTSKHKAPPPDTTTGVQLVDASDLKGVYARAVEDKSSDTSKHKAPPPDTTTGVQLADVSDLKGVFARAVKVKSSDTSKHKAPPPDTTTGVQLADVSDLKGVFAKAVEVKSSDTSKHKAPPSDSTTGVQLADVSDLKGVFARAVEVKSSDTSKHKAPPPDSTIGVQLADVSDLKGVFAKAVMHKSSGTSKRKAPPPDTTTGVQLADVSDLKGVFARAVEVKSSDTSKHKAPPPDSTTGVQLADVSDLKGVFAKAVKHKSSGTSKRKAPPPDTTTGVQLADASDLKGVYARPVKDKSSGTITGYKYEPRFTPPREKVDDGTTGRFNRLSLGEYHTRDEAKIVPQIVRFYYDKDQDCVELDDGQFKYFIPPMNEQERGLAGEEKRKWVTNKAKQVYADLGIQKRNFEQSSVGNRTGAHSSHDSDIRVSEIASVSSANALEVPSCPVPLPSRDVVDDYCETLSGFGHMIDDLLCPVFPSSSPQQASLNSEMHFLGFGQIPGGPSSSQADGVTQGIQSSIDAPFSPRVDFHQGWDLVGTGGSNFCAKRRDPVLQQLVHRQKQQLEVYALQIVGLEHQLCESQIQISELQEENERLRTRQFSNGSLI